MAKRNVPRQEKKPKRNPAPRKTAVEPREAIRRMLDGPCLSDCTQRYIKAIHAPWSAIRACVPLPPCFPSQKLQCWYKGTMSTGTQGIGFVFVDPVQGVTNDKDFGTYTGSNFAGTGLDQNPLTTGVTAFQSNSPFVDSNFTADETYYRIVAVGIRVRYVGSELNRGGSVVSLVEPDHASLNGFGIGSLLSYAGVHTQPTGRRWHECVWFPIDATEIAYRNSPSAEGTMCMAVMVKAASAGTAVSYEFEVYGKYEIHGIKARGQDIMRGDTIGGSATIEHFAGHAPTGRIDSTAESIRHSLDAVDGIVKDASGVYSALKHGAAKAKGWWDATIAEVNNLIPSALEAGEVALAAR